MREVTIYIILLAIVTILVIVFNKKSQNNYRKRKSKRFLDGYLEKRKEREKQED